MMDWQQKFAAIKAFAPDCSLEMRQPGDWYVSGGMSIGGNGMLTGSYGNGATPDKAVEEHWSIYSTLPYDRYAVNRANNRARWNGFMWAEITEDQAKVLIEGARA